MRHGAISKICDFRLTLTMELFIILPRIVINSGYPLPPSTPVDGDTPLRAGLVDGEEKCEKEAGSMKKAISILLAVIFVVALMPSALASSNGTNTAPWDGESREEIPYVNGQYEISTGAQLAKLSDNVNSGTSYSGQTVVIVDDIDLGGHSLIPIGTRDDGFKGTLTGVQKGDGTYTAIMNADINYGSSIQNVGVIGFVEGGTVKDLYFNDVHVVSTSNVSSSTGSDYESSTGVAVGTLNGGSITNVTVMSNCSVSGKLRTGGIAGDANGTNSSISGCNNNGTVTGSASYTGGIVGATHNILNYFASTGTTITNCTNTGNVYGTSEVGGIIGYADRANVSGCINSGNVTGSGNYGTGGIIGCDIYNPRSILAPLNGSTMTECTNSGDITAPRAGGILGSYVVSPGNNQPSLSNKYSTISSCTNTGNISSPNGNGKCGSIYGAPITYKSGDGDDYVDRMIVKIISCTVGGKVEGNTLAESGKTFEQFISPSTHVQLSGNVTDGVN